MNFRKTIDPRASNKRIGPIRRQRSSHGVGKSPSDTELAQGKSRGRKSKSKEKWPLLEGLTVDELARYRRRRVQGQPRDNLPLYPELQDKVLVSEYRETFRASSEDLLKVGILNEITIPLNVLLQIFA